jgi:hypothetical protein
MREEDRSGWWSTHHVVRRARRGGRHMEP